MQCHDTHLKAEEARPIAGKDCLDTIETGVDCHQSQRIAAAENNPHSLRVPLCRAHCGGGKPRTTWAMPYRERSVGNACTVLHAMTTLVDERR